MIGVAEARRILLDHVRPRGVERIALRLARGRTLREEIVADRPHPPFHASAMDGYALRARDTPGVLKLVGEAGAGRALSRPLGPGECARIFTGAALPESANAVLIQEEAERSGDSVRAPAVESGRHVRAAGVDFPAGQLLLAPGRILDAPSVALAAAAGRPSIVVSQAPRVAILGGGDEIVSPGQTPGPEQIYDSMSFGIAALAESWGACATTSHPMADDAQGVASAMSSAIGEHDLVVVVGGASVGDHDHARPALRTLGGDLLFEKVAVRPGKPTWFALLDDKLVLGLPGNPASAFVCARLFLRPMLDAFCSRDPAASIRTTPARTKHSLPANGPRETYLRSHTDVDPAGQSWTAAAPNQDSSLLSVFADANALIVREPHAPAAPEGALVRTLPF
ncbi:MAG: gephyrin-like molybdotransferase Glp [Hyphomonadaceae bacterium]